MSRQAVATGALVIALIVGAVVLPSNALAAKKCGDLNNENRYVRIRDIRVEHMRCRVGRAVMREYRARVDDDPLYKPSNVTVGGRRWTCRERETTTANRITCSFDEKRVTAILFV